MTARQKFVPREYTHLAVEFLAQTPRCMLLARMGMGKTVMCATLLDILYNVDGQTEPTLIIAPKRVAQTTWPDELAKWDHLRGLEIAAAVGTAQERAAALRKDVPLHTINYDNLPWLMNHLSGRWPYRRVVSDESTRLKSFRTKQGSVQAGALRAVAHTKVKEWWNLTGSPSPNGLKDLWGQMWFVDQGKRLGYNYSAFEERWFAYRRVKDALSNKVEIKPTIMPFADEQIREAMRDVCLTLDPKDWFDLKDPVVTRIEVELPAKARRHYNDMENEMFTRLDGYDIEAFGAAGKTIKCLQCANGAMYVDDTATEWVEVHDAKLQALESIIEEAAGAPVMVAYHFKSDLARLRRAFPRGVVLDSGSKVQTAWNKGQVPLLFVYPASMGHGLNFQEGGNILVFFGHWWDLEKHDQVIERIGPMRQLQAGIDRAVFIYYIVARDTVDEVVIDRHTTKRRVQTAFLEYMKRRTTK
jgi:SNF2 family DNA or RNA helicase